jgi:AbrB family looped-hinge helix DNA binding protein
MKITTKGQVTIPQDLRERYGLLPHTEVSFKAVEDGVLIRSSKTKAELIDERLERANGSATIPISTDDIMQMTRAED